MKVSDAMVDAAMNAKNDHPPRSSPMIMDPEAFKEAIWEMAKVDMRRALEAALAMIADAEPEPEYVVTDVMLEAAGETMHGDNWHNVRKFSWITGPMREGIEAAERVRRNEGDGR